MNLLNFKYTFKQIIKINKNILLKKILTFKKQKWKSYKLNYKFLTKLKNKYKLIDQNKNLLNSYGNKSNSYKYKYKNFFYFYKNLKHLFDTKNFLTFINKQNLTIKFFETRIDFVMVKSKYCFSIKLAKQLILNQYVFVNNKKLDYKQWFLKSGDIIKCIFNESFSVKSEMWPLPKYIINYKIKELYFLKFSNENKFTGFFPLYFKKLDYDCGLKKFKIK